LIGTFFPVVEAMKAGCPLWSSNSSSVKELLGKNYPISFSPSNWNEAEDVFESLTNEKVRSMAIGIGLEQSKIFSWEKCANQTLEIYNKLLNDE